MRLLVLGGTKFLGRHAVEEALHRGYHVTILHRGETGAELYAAPAAAGRLVRIVGDRARLAEPGNAASAVLAGASFDAVIDTSGYDPEVVRQSVELLARVTPCYLFVSSISVYAAFTGANPENAPLAVMPESAQGAPVKMSGTTYGPLKSACEDEVRRVFGARALTLRPGLIVGPYDPTDRFTYWVRRLAEGGVALAPGDGARRVQFIDARDLAMLMLDQCERGDAGTFNVTGASIAMREFLEVARAALGDRAARLQWVDEAFLAQHAVAPWTELPTWLWDDQTIAIERALAAGLRFRPLTETVLATRAFDLERGEPKPMLAGLASERERALLAAFAATFNGPSTKTSP